MSMSVSVLCVVLVGILVLCECHFCQCNFGLCVVHCMSGWYCNRKCCSALSFLHYILVLESEFRFCSSRVWLRLSLLIMFHQNTPKSITLHAWNYHFIQYFCVYIYINCVLCKNYFKKVSVTSNLLTPNIILGC